MASANLLQSPAPAPAVCCVTALAVLAHCSCIWFRLTPLSTSLPHSSPPRPWAPRHSDFSTISDTSKSQHPPSPRQDTQTAFAFRPNSMAIWRTNEGFRQNSIHLSSLSFAHCPLCESRRRRPRRQAVTGLQQTPNSRVQRPCPLSWPATGPASIDRPNDSLSRSTSKHQPLRPQSRSHRDTFHLTCKTTVPTCARHRDRHTAHTAVLTPALYHILWPEVHHVWPFPGAKLSPEPRSLGSHRLPTTYTYSTLCTIYAVHCTRSCRPHLAARLSFSL